LLYTHIHTRIHTCTHTHIYIYIHTCILLVNQHDVIINTGGVEVLLDVLYMFRIDEEIVYLIFQIFVTLMYGDEKNKMKPQHDHQHKYQYQYQYQNQYQRQENKNENKFQTAKRIYLNGSKDLIENLSTIYEHHEDIRILGKSIMKDLFKAKSYAAMDALWYVLFEF
jgi:hypothetical protein